LADDAGVTVSNWLNVTRSNLTTSSIRFLLGTTSNIERMTLLSNGYVGIGTSTPASILDISGSGATVRITDIATGGIPALDFIRGSSPTFGGDVYTDWRIYNTGGVLRFYRKDTFTPSDGDAMVITDLGRVGIGTTAPATNLDISSGTAACAVFNRTISGNNNFFLLRNVGANRWGFAAINADTGSADGGSDFGLNPYADNGSLLSVPFMVKRSNGYVGVATTAPGSILQVSSNSDTVYANNSTLSSNTITVFGAAAGAPTYAGTANLYGTLFVNTTTAHGQNVGASLALGGRGYNFGGGNQHMTFARVQGVQAVSTSAFAGDLVMETQSNGSMYERMRINPYGAIGVGTSYPRSGLSNNAQNTSIYSLDVSGQIYGRLPVYINTGTTMDISTAASNAAYRNTYIYLTNSGFSNLNFPTTALTSAFGGTFFQLKNSTTSYMNVSVTGTIGITSPVTIAPSNAITFVVSPSNAGNAMLLF
jgi:hypothetical protein